MKCEKKVKQYNDNDELAWVEKELGEEFGKSLMKRANRKIKKLSRIKRA